MLMSQSLALENEKEKIENTSRAQGTKKKRKRN